MYAKDWNFLLSSAITLIKNSYLGWYLDFWHEILGNLDVMGRNGLHICIQQEKSYQNGELFFLGFEKALKMQASVIIIWGCGKFNKNFRHFRSGRSLRPLLKTSARPLSLVSCLASWNLRALFPILLLLFASDYAVVQKCHRTVRSRRMIICKTFQYK